MKKNLILLIVAILVVSSLTACTSKTFSTSELRFKKDIGTELGEDFGMVFIKLTEHSISWYNNYVTKNDGELSNELAKEVSSIYLDVLSPMLQLGLLNKTEKEIVREQTLDGNILWIMANNELLEKEDNLRKKNLGKMTEEEYKKLISSNKTSIENLKEEIQRILDTYFE